MYLGDVAPPAIVYRAYCASVLQQQCREAGCREPELVHKRRAAAGHVEAFNLQSVAPFLSRHHNRNSSGQAPHLEAVATTQREPAMPNMPPMRPQRPSENSRVAAISLTVNAERSGSLPGL